MTTTSHLKFDHDSHSIEMKLHLPTNLRFLYNLFFPLLIPLFVLWVFFPGGMTTDSLQYLEIARSWQFRGEYAPIISILWMPLDLLWPGPAPMVLLINALISYGMYFILLSIFRSILISSICSWAVLLFPPVFSILGVVWADTLMLGLFLSLTATVIYAKDETSHRRKIILQATAVLLGVLTFSVRHNSAPLILPILSYYYINEFRPLNIRAIFIWLTKIALTAVIIYAISLSINALIPRPKFTLWQGCATFDIAGVSARSNKNYFENTIFGSKSIEDIKTLYHPRSLFPLYEGKQIHRPEGGSAAPFTMIPVDNTIELQRLRSAWMSAIIRDFPTWLTHRIEVTKEFTGYTDTWIWTPAWDGIPKNTLGVPEKNEPDVNHPILKLCLKLAARTWIYRAYFYILASVGLCIALVCFFRKPGISKIFFINTAGLIHLAILCVFAFAADYRYMHFTITISCLCIAISSILLIRNITKRITQRFCLRTLPPSECPI